MLSGFDAPGVVRQPGGSRLERDFRWLSKSEEMCVLRRRRWVMLMLRSAFGSTQLIFRPIVSMGVDALQL